MGRGMSKAAGGSARARENASNAEEPRGRSMSIRRFLEEMQRSNQEAMERVLQQANLSIDKATFTANGNSVREQWATLESGGDKLDIRFHTNYNPQQVQIGREAISSGIDVYYWKNGNITAIRKIAETKSRSVKNGEKQYQEMLERWKRLTKQKQIKF